MLDFLPIVAEMSKAFQSESVLLFEVPILIQGDILALESLKTNPGTHMKEFLDMFERDMQIWQCKVDKQTPESHLY